MREYLSRKNLPYVKIDSSKLAIAPVKIEAPVVALLPLMVIGWLFLVVNLATICCGIAVTLRALPGLRSCSVRIGWGS